MEGITGGIGRRRIVDELADPFELCDDLINFTADRANLCLLDHVPESGNVVRQLSEAILVGIVANCGGGWRAREFSCLFFFIFVVFLVITPLHHVQVKASW